MTVREVMQEHCRRGGHWEIRNDNRGRPLLVAAWGDDEINNFSWAGFDPDDDGACLAHDIGLEVTA